MNFNAELLNEARNEGYSEKEIWNYISSQNPKFNEAKQEGYSLDDVAGYFTKSAAPAQERDALQTVAEELEAGIGRAGGAFAQAAVGSVRMITDAFGANNPVSKKISGVEDYLDQFVSAQARQDKEEISRLFQEAEGKGLGAKVMAGLEAVTVSPETLGPEIAGYMLPSLATGVLASLAAAPTAVAIGAQAIIGGIQSAGTIKGEIYKSVRDFSREQGLTEEQADKAASEAQAYGGKNLDQILISAGIGAVAASTGVERIATRILSGQGKEVTKKSIGEFIKTGLKAAPVEGVVEGVQEGQEQMAKNIALQREGADVSTFKMVPQVTTMGTVAGGLMGGAAGGIEYVSAEQKKLTDIEKTSDREARMLSAPDAASKNIINFLNQTENGIDSLREELDTLEPTDPKAQNLRMRISEEQKKADAIMVSIGEKKEETVQQVQSRIEKAEVELVGLEPTSRKAKTLEAQIAQDEAKVTALSEPITKAEEEQARLAMEIAAPVEEAVTPPVSPAQAVEQLEVSIPVSGQPFEFLSIRNTEQAPQLGTQFGQDIEPSGKYISQSTPDAARNLDERFEKGVIRFENPLVVEFGGEYGTPTNWKNVLSSQYEGKTGTELSQAVRDAGYDGIVTVEPSTGPNRPAQTSEIVDIRSIKPSVTTAAPTPVTTPAPEAVAPVTEQAAPTEAPAPEVAPTKEIEKKVNVNGINITAKVPIRYFRFGEPTIGVPSTNFLTGKKEKGISVYAGWTDPETGKIYLLPTETDETEFGEIIQTQDALLSSDKKLVEVNGIDSGKIGADGEILLEPKSVSIVSEIDKNKLASTDEAPDFAKGKFTEVWPEGIKKPNIEIKEVEGGFQVFVNGTAPSDAIWATREVASEAATSEYEYEMRKAKKKATPAVSETITEPTTAPAGPAVGNRIKLGRSPQAYTIEEVIPQTETEKELGEQYYNVKNEKTGEVQAVEAKDLKLVKKMPIRKAISKPVPTAPEKRVEIKSIVEVAMKMFGSDFVAGRLYVMDDVNEESKAGYDPEDGTIYLNLAFMDTDDSIRDLIAHELGHYIFGDPSLRSKFTEFINSLPKRERVILDRFVNKVYRKDTGEVKIEEKEVRAFIMRLNAGDNRNKFQKLLDGIKRWLNEKLGTKFKMTDRDAAILLAGAVDRFKSGELIEREEGFGVRKMAAERIDDRSQIAGVKGIGAMKDTPKGINKETESIIRRSVFNSDIVNDSQTKKAWDLIESIDEKNPDAGKNAQDINELTRETMQDANVDEIVKQTIGAAKLRNELFQYAIKLTAEGDRSMLDYLLNNRLALAGGAITEGDAGRLLQALSSLKSWIIRSSEAEKQGFFAVAAQQFFDTKTPTEEQVKQIQSMFEAVKKVKINQEKDLMEELEKVGKATGIDVAQTVEAEVRRGAKAKAESEADILTKEYNKIQTQAETQIERLANIQSDTPAFVKIKTNEIRKIVNDDLKNTPDMGRKDAWKSMLTAKHKDAGVNETDASLLSELVWRQHEINDTNRKMDEVVKAVEKGAIKGMVEAILNTPLSEQQNPEWRKDVIKNYLIEAGVASSKAESISKLFDLSLRKRFAQAQEKAAEKAAKAIMGKLTPNSRRALEKFIRAIRTQVLSPGSDVAKAFGEQMGWKGFTAEQYARLSELDSIVSNEDTLDLERATAFKEIQNIIASASIPPRVRDAISSFYVAQALSGIPTATVNVFSPIGYALRYAMTDGMKVAIKNPSKLPTVFSAMISSFKSYASEVAYSWNNNVQRRGVVEYLANDEKLLAVYNKGKKQWAEGNRAEGFKNMLFGSMEYVSRMLKALDEGALSVLEQQGLSRYAMAAMDKAGIKTSEQIAVANMVMKSKQEFILDSIAKGMSKRDATAFSDDVYRSAWQEALSKLKINSQQVLDSAINDALSAVGRINTTIDPLTGTEQKRISDRGFASSLPIGFLESISQAANSKESNEIQRIFYRMMYGFAIVPARVFREAAWFSPYGFVRFALDKGAKSMGYTSPYEQSLGTDLQRTQRLTETIAGTIVMLGAMAMANSSVDDPEDELPFKVVFTGNGPDRRLDPQFFDTWRDKYKPNSINVFFGKTKFSINIERGFEAFAIPFMMAGAIDDWKIRKRFEQTKKTPKDISDATIILGSAFMSFNKRGPYAAFTNTYSSFKNSDNSIAELVKQGAFYGKTFIPVIGSSLARNVSDFINDPIDRTSLDGALYSNIPVLGPMMGTKSMNAVGQTQGATDFSDRLYKAGIPLVFSLPKNSGSEKINQIILKQGQGPSIPTRYNVRQRIGYEPNNKQYETFVTEYGKYMANKMTQNHDSLMNKKPTSYMKTIENWSDTARNIATKEAKKISNPNAP